MPLIGPHSGPYLADLDGVAPTFMGIRSKIGKSLSNRSAHLQLH